MISYLFAGAHLSLTDAGIEALDNLRAQGQRSALALLGILIGAASIVAVLSIGHMAQLETLKVFRNLGADLLNFHASPTGSATTGAMDRATIEQLPARDSAVLEATAFISDHDKVYAGSKSASVSIGAVTASLPRLVKLQLRQGRFIQQVDDNNLVAVIGPQVAASLSSPGAPITPGASITVEGYVFKVIGVLEPAPDTAVDPISVDDAVMIPLSGARRVFASAEPTGALVRLRPQADAEAAGKRISAILAGPTTTLTVVNARTLIKGMNAQKAIHQNLLAAVGAISLFVGGIGVMNVMLMGVIERRREIGLRAAVGATPGDIGLMFLIEAAVLAFVGGVAGLLVGLVLAFVSAKASDWNFSLALWVLPLGPGIATMVGLAFGFYPALKASRLSPIDALRAE